MGDVCGYYMRITDFLFANVGVFFTFRFRNHLLVSFVRLLKVVEITVKYVND